jgi:hypothetical protein
MKEAGIWGCTVLSGKALEVDGVPAVQINVVIDDGPSKGQRCTYEDTVNAQSAKYVNWSIAAVGWKGKTLSTLEADINEWIAKTGGKTTVEIKHLEIKRGKKAGELWDKVSGIGRGAPKPGKPLAGSTLSDADEAMRSVLGDVPPPNDGDIPF